MELESTSVVATVWGKGEVEPAANSCGTSFLGGRTLLVVDMMVMSHTQ